MKAKKFLFPNGVDKKSFFKISQKAARKELGLDNKIKIVGFIGSVDSRVEENLQAICTSLEKKNVNMIVCGHNYEKIKGKNIILNGFLPSEKVNTVINALSLGIVPNRKDEFTDFCFPSKLMEYMACEIPCLATPLPSLEKILPQTCIGPYDMEEFSKSILKILKTEKINYSKDIVSEYYWENLVSNIYEKIKNAE
ncbi:glycosyltransferase [Candidatus Woesearchaeota archaeon]|nr:glycosyltransferase [Candidatus Woesearchaeota archaeon]